MDMSKTFVIGDVHGHFDRLEALLKQEGIVGPCDRCRGTGDEFDRLCPRCDGDGQTRIDYDTTVIQLGDLGHFGGESGSPSGDKMCYLYADRYLDVVLWGNHERPLVDLLHSFQGYQHPGIHVERQIEYLREIGKMKLAVAAHGYLIVHAGVSSVYSYLAQRYGNAYIFADYLNELDEKKLNWLKDNPPRFSEIKHKKLSDPDNLYRKFEIIDSISFIRGGSHPDGGVLWFDWNREPHLEGPFKFICGHTAQSDGVVKADNYGNLNIDIGGKYENRLAGVWLEDGEEPKARSVNFDKEN